MKGGWPIATNQFFFWTLFMGSYIYMKNKFYLLWVYNDFPYNLCKAQFIGLAFLFASAVSYPFY